jgi:16S rRNA C967 or C1407 C5-methylase (RsmB/RsmF family)
MGGGNAKGKVFAFDKDEKRLGTLRKLTARAKCPSTREKPKQRE